ncbi:hypothetical protein DAEQUDRAFT_761136 [Daedalea quercina L-15889]|uniref:Uncharacterized protein n=1 Tax=Daedalea quercina L-15889 TaxID=1314783 RepID=A0A165UNP1_9APHY|nr:hypothetical protein DAEQUDRAFT_761136 [Daedalea quercina L-15889]
MDSYAFSADRAYGSPPAPHHVPMATSSAQFPADLAQVPFHGAAPYALHYNYPAPPVYAQHPYTESLYIQPQPVTSYSFPPISDSAPSTSNATYHHPVPLHAPIPVSPYSTLISPVSPLSQATNDNASTAPAEFSDTKDSLDSPPPSPAASGPNTAAPPVTAEQSPLEYYGNAPQVMFPTPSELLTELSARDAAGKSSEPGRKATASDSSEASEAQPPAAPAKGGKSKKTGDAVAPPKPPSETQRKAYFRKVAESVGFAPTDPDTITSHDKKRSYLECLEQYVQWLHEQIRLVGREPLPLERVQEYRGPSSRSIRTLLVHMQDEVRDLHERMVEDERAYVHLQRQVQMQHASAAAHQLRRHSVAACGPLDATVSASGPFLQPYPVPSLHLSHNIHGQYQQY